MIQASFLTSLCCCHNRAGKYNDKNRKTKKILIIYPIPYHFRNRYLADLRNNFCLQSLIPIYFYGFSFRRTFP